MIRAAREVVLVVTHDKIGRRSFSQVVPVTSIQTIVTDTGADEAAVAALESAGVKVLLV